MNTKHVVSTVTFDVAEGKMTDFIQFLEEIHPHVLDWDGIVSCQVIQTSDTTAVSWVEHESQEALEAIGDDYKATMGSFAEFLVRPPSRVVGETIVN